MRLMTLGIVAFTIIGVTRFLSAADGEQAVKEPGTAMILSTGDNLFYYKWFPIDSPAGVGASFDIFKSHYGVNRIVWRGAQAQWMAYDNVFRPEAEELADLYVMEMELETKDQLSRKAAEEAKKRGFSFWGYMPFFEVGASAETVSMAGFGPYNFEEKIRAEHPEYRLYDRAGITSGGIIEFGYPEVRKAFLKRYDEWFSEGGEFSIYDGIIFYTYVENFFPRHSDQFIYSDIAAKDFKQRYGVDIYSEPFDMGKYLELRGEYVTQYLRELREVFNKHGKKLAFYIDVRKPEEPQCWPSYPQVLVPGRIKMEWQKWVSEGLVDEISLREIDRREGVQPFVDALKGTNIHLSLLTSRIPPEMNDLHKLGVSRHIWSPELASEFPPENAPASALDGSDRIAMMSVLRQVRDGELDVPVEKLIALFDHPDLIVRRQAIAAVLGRRMTDAIPALEKAALDPENSFRCVVIDALGTLHGPNSAAAVGKALETYPIMAMRLVARTAWSMMMPDRTDDLVKLYHSTQSPYVRASIVEMVVAKRAVQPIDAIPAFRPLINHAAVDSDLRTRNMATLALAYYPDLESARMLLKLLDDPEDVIQNTAAFSLGEIARRVDDRAMRHQIYDRLVERARQYGEGSKRKDQEWGYRVIAEALIYGFGPRGHQHIVATLNGSDMRLADQAWRVLFHPNDGWNFYPLDIRELERLTTYHPAPHRTLLPKRKYEVPTTTTILETSFAGFSPDPTGVLGNIWSTEGKWTGLDDSISVVKRDGKDQLELSVNASGKGARLAGSTGYDLPDGRFKNRLRGHFPSSPIAYGLCDGIVELTFDVHHSSSNDAVQIGLAPGSSSGEIVGCKLSAGGKVQMLSNTMQSSEGRYNSGSASARLRLQLDFNAGEASLFEPESDHAIATIKFDINKQYRAIVLQAAGEPATTTRIGAIKLTQQLAK